MSETDYFDGYMAATRRADALEDELHALKHAIATLKPRTLKLNAHRQLEYHTPDDLQKLLDRKK